MSGETVEQISIPRAKRIFDIIVVLVLLFSLSPLVLLIMLWIFVEQIIIPASRGSILYCETRISAARPFKLCKFRIFKQEVLNREKERNKFIHTKPLEGDKKNLTYYGRFLKQVYLDELPQLINVLKGEMTLVGPRPTNLEISDRLRRSGDYTKEKMICGITGPFQSQKGEQRLKNHFKNYTNGYQS